MQQIDQCDSGEDQSIFSLFCISLLMFLPNQRQNSYLRSSAHNCGLSGILFDLGTQNARSKLIRHNYVLRYSVILPHILFSLTSNDLCEFNREIKSKHRHVVLRFGNLRIPLQESQLTIESIRCFLIIFALQKSTEDINDS